MGEYHSIQSVLSPCCKTAWFHRDCLCRYADSCGYTHFKCPKCSNTEDFRAEIPNRGVFIPEKDASWEQEPNAFSELLDRPSSCAAEVCKCEKGREFNEENGPWDFQICLGCGSKCIHADCLNLPEDQDIYYICELCEGKVPQKLIDMALKDSDSEGEETLNNFGFRRRRKVSDEQNSSPSSRATTSSGNSTASRSRRRSKGVFGMSRYRRTKNDRRRQRIASSSSESEDKTVKIPPNVKLYDCRVLIHRIHSFDNSSLSNFSEASNFVAAEKKKLTAREEILNDWLEESLSNQSKAGNAGKLEEAGNSFFEKLKKPDGAGKLKGSGGFEESEESDKSEISKKYKRSGKSEKSESAEKFSQPENSKNLEKLQQEMPEIPKRNQKSLELKIPEASEVTPSKSWEIQEIETPKKSKTPKKSRKSKSKAGRLEKPREFDDYDIIDITETSDYVATPLKFKISGNLSRSDRKSKKKLKKHRTESKVCNSKEPLVKDPEKIQKDPEKLVEKEPEINKIEGSPLKWKLPGKPAVTPKSPAKLNSSHEENIEPNTKKRKRGSSGSKICLEFEIFQPFINFFLNFRQTCRNFEISTQ